MFFKRILCTIKSCTQAAASTIFIGWTKSKLKISFSCQAQKHWIGSLRWLRSSDALLQVAGARLPGRVMWMLHTVSDSLSLCSSVRLHHIIQRTPFLGLLSMLPSPMKSGCWCWKGPCKAPKCAIFQLFCSFYSSEAFYSKADCMHCFESAKLVKAVWHKLTCTVNAKLDFVTKLFQNVNKQGGMQISVEFSSTWTILGHHFQATASIWVRLMCNLSWRRCGFYLSTASNQVQLLYTTSVKLRCMHFQYSMHKWLCDFEKGLLEGHHFISEANQSWRVHMRTNIEYSHKHMPGLHNHLLIGSISLMSGVDGYCFVCSSSSPGNEENERKKKCHTKAMWRRGRWFLASSASLKRTHDFGNDVMWHEHPSPLFLNQTLCEHSGALVKRAAKQVLRVCCFYYM